MVRMLVLCAVLSFVSLSSFAQSRPWIRHTAKVPTNAVTVEPVAQPAVEISPKQAVLEETVPANWVVVDGKDHGAFHGHMPSWNGRPVYHMYSRKVPYDGQMIMCIMPRLCLKNLQPPKDDTSCESVCYERVTPQEFTHREDLSEELWTILSESGSWIAPKPIRLVTERGKQFLIMTTPVRGPVMKEAPPPPLEYACNIETVSSKFTTPMLFAGRSFNIDLHECFGKPEDVIR